MEKGGAYYHVCEGVRDVVSRTLWTGDSLVFEMRAQTLGSLHVMSNEMCEGAREDRMKNFSDGSSFAKRRVRMVPKF